MHAEIPSDKMLVDFLTKITNNKKGIEIGGPSDYTGNIIYQNASNIDNVIFSKNTVWSIHDEEYHYYMDKKGKVLINDAVDISSVKDGAYDFCFSSHCLEHIANPLKAIYEWLRVIKEDGYIIIVVPEKNECFDHKRDYSTFSKLLSQYEKNVSEDDLSTLPEILLNHDLTLDTPAGNLEQFIKRSLDNFNNRCLHHYVYNPNLLLEISNYFNCEFIYSVTIDINIWFIMKKSEVNTVNSSVVRTLGK
jgi:SAM-dependent methyltransferase